MLSIHVSRKNATLCDVVVVVVISVVVFVVVDARYFALI